MEPMGSPTSGSVVRPGLLIDTKAYGKLRTFSGKEEDWTTWAFVARSYMDLLSHEYRDLVQHAELMDGPNDLSLDKLSPTAVAHGWTLYNVLVQSVEGRALSILMGAEANNGLQAWRMLMDSYEPRIGGRYTAMLMGIIGPQWQNVKESEFLETLDSWEVLVRRYQDQSGEEVTPATKCAVVMKFAPQGIRLALRTSSSAIGSDYNKLKKCVKDYLQTGVAFDPQGMSRAANSGDVQPMDVGALEKGWKGKGSKGSYGKSSKGKKGKEEKGKSGKKGVKGKSKWSGSSGRFEGNCSYCGKYGHKKADCKTRERDRAAKGKGGSTGSVEDASPTAGTGSASPKGSAAVYYDLGNDGARGSGEVGAVTTRRPGETFTQQVKMVPKMPKRPRWSEVQDDEMEEVEVEEEKESPEGLDNVGEEAHERVDESPDYGSSEWSSDSFLGWERSSGPRTVGAVVCAAGRGYVARCEDDHKNFIMYDTGSDEHVCTMDFGGGGNLVASQVRLNAVSGDALDIRGERKVAMTFVGKGRDMVLDVVFQVSKNATKNILSAGKLYRAGFVVTIGKDGASTLWHPTLDVHIPLFLYGNSFYLRLKDSESKYRHSRTPDAMVAPVSDANSPEGWEHVGEEEVEDEPNLEDLPELRGGVVEDEQAGQLTPFSRVVDLRARLKELGWSTHGSKEVLYNRLKAAEKEEKKMREKRRKAEEEATKRNEDLTHEAKMLPEPGKPTAAEVAKHNLTHIPSADWCEHCQKGKGKDRGHTKAEGAVDRAVIQMDYSYLKADGTETVEDAAEVILTAVDTGSGMTTAISLPAKNWEMGYVVRTLKSFIGQLGHVNVALRTDGEPTVVQMAELLRDELNKTRLKDAVVRAYTERTPRYSPQSLGHVGARQALIKGDTLTMKSKLEEDYKRPITPKDTIWPWMVRHAAWVRSRYGLKASRRTAFEDAFGHSYISAIVPFGEVVLFKMPASSSGRRTQGGRQLKGDFSWEKGIFVGKTNESDEFLLATKRGVHTARTVKRLREELRISEELMAEIKGVPWNTGTSIGRPRRPLADALPSSQTPKPAATGDAPGEKPIKMVKGRAVSVPSTPTGRKAEEEAEGSKLLKRTKVTDSSATLADDVDVRNYVDFPGSSTERAAASDDAMVVDPQMESRVPTEEEMRSTEAWRKREAQLLERVEEVPKRMRISDQVVGALYTPVLEPEEPEVDEEAIEEVLEVQPLSDEESWRGGKLNWPRWTRSRLTLLWKRRRPWESWFLIARGWRPESPQERQNAGIACERSRATAIEMMSMLWQQHQLRPSW